MNSMLITLLAVCSIAACYSKQPQAVENGATDTCLHATVQDTSDVACGLPLLLFAEDSAAIRAITERESNVYVAKNLPPALNIKGKKLCVKVALLTAEEDFNCIMIGITYPHIKVVSAKERE